MYVRYSFGRLQWYSIDRYLRILPVTFTAKTKILYFRLCERLCFQNRDLMKEFRHKVISCGNGLKLTPSPYLCVYSLYSETVINEIMFWKLSQETLPMTDDHFWFIWNICKRKKLWSRLKLFVWRLNWFIIWMLLIHW